MKIKSKLSLVTGLSLAPLAASVALSGCTRAIKYQEYHILTINDLHGAIPGYGEDVSIVDKNNPGCFRIQKEVEKVMQEHPGSIFLSAGDENSGDSWSTCSHGQTTYPVLKSMGVRYCAVGNHAFEWGIDDVGTGLYDRLGRTDETEGKYFVTSNIFSTDGYDGVKWCVDETNPKFQEDFNLWNKLRVAWADPYKIINFGPAKVCLIGLTTTGTKIDGNREVTDHLSFVDYDASVHYSKYLAKKELGEEQYNAIDSFILFTHCGGEWNDKLQKLEGEAAALAETISTDVDAIISAHSHKTYATQVENLLTGKKIWVSQAGTAGRFLGDTKIIVDPTALPGKRITSVEMSVKKIDVPTDETTAKKEWEEYCNSNNMGKVASAFNYEKGWVRQFFTRHLSQVSLKENTDEMQYPDVTKGYYNGVKHTIDPFTQEPTIVGHDYYDCSDILDHFGGWICRCMQLGYYYYYKDIAQYDEAIVPSCCFTTQDSCPAELVNGNLTVREVYNMIPYDNKLQISYLNIFQLANMINYSLAGKPNEDQTKGFKYHAKPVRYYEPDLNSFIGNPDDPDSEGSYFHTGPSGDEKNQINASYVSGPMMFYGVKANIIKITEQEHAKTHKKLCGDTSANLYDETATYRVNTIKKDVEIQPGVTKTVWLPDMSVFKYKVNEDGTDNIEDLDNPNSDSWKDAEWWYLRGEAQADAMELIPVLTNSFMYGGGNDQTTQFKKYQEFNYSIYKPYFRPFESDQTVRTVLEDFFLKSLDEGLVWKDGMAPTNLVWSKVKALVTKLN